MIVTKVQFAKFKELCAWYIQGTIIADYKIDIKLTDIERNTIETDQAFDMKYIVITISKINNIRDTIRVVKETLDKCIRQHNYHQMLGGYYERQKDITEKFQSIPS